ncbi:glycosyltransferase [Parapedobacter tibetensis]|uniref:glycosyltransferase n=1 Tax=Parapedobacter tibetensis TaxID=2972951 RepID=UPI00214D3E0A|nr:glycosyltransferase [Parapedobacter tibetensis]
MHIYLFNTYNYSRDYGITTYINELSNHFCGREGINLTIVTLQSDGSEFSVSYDKEKRLREINIPWPFNIPVISLFENDKMQKYSLSVSCLLSEYISPIEHNTFHLNYNQHVSLIPFLRKLAPSSRIIFTVHYIRWVSLIDGNLEAFRKIIANEETSADDRIKQLVHYDYVSLENISQQVDSVIVLSSYTYKLLSVEYDIPASKIILLPNTLSDRAAFKSRKEIERLKAQIGIGRSEKVLLYAGRLQSSKGLHVLLRAFGKAVDRYPNMRLIIAGGGNYDEFMKMCTSFCGKMIFMGRVEKDLLYDLYSMADIGLQPSLNEQCSYVVIEMFMHGLPVIGFDATGISDMIDNDFNGYKLPAQDEDFSLSDTQVLIDRLTEAILKLLNDNPKRDYFALNARQTFEDRYNTKTVGEEFYSEVYHAKLFNSQIV